MAIGRHGERSPPHPSEQRQEHAQSGDGAADPYGRKTAVLTTAIVAVVFAALAAVVAGALLGGAADAGLAC